MQRHDIPISAIPCLAYRKALEEEAKQKEIDRQIEEQIKNGTWRQYHPPTKIENNKKTDISSENQVKKCPFKHGASNQNSTKKSSINNELNDQEMSETQKTNVVETTKTKEKPSDIQISDDIDRTNLPNGEEINDNIANVDQAMENGECSQDSGEMNQNSVENYQTIGEIIENNDETSQNNVEITELNVVEEVPLNRQPVVLPGGIVMPPPRVETVSTSWKTQHLTHDEVNDYSKKLFLFKTVNIMHFK